MSEKAAEKTKAFQTLKDLDQDPDVKLAEARADYLKARPSQHWNQKGLSEPEAGVEATDMVPGKLEMSAKIKLHTKLAINLFRGQKSDPATNFRGIIGLARFARQVANIWSASAIDDPYADQCLIEIEQAWKDAKTLIDGRTKTLKALLTGMDDFEVETQASVEPVTIELKFFSPWGFRGALLLRDLDQMIRLALTGRHLGLIMDSDWNRTVTDSLRAVRHMFAQVMNWTHTAVTRNDIAANNKVAIRAKQKYTTVNQRYLDLSIEVLRGDLRAELSPLNRIQETQRRVAQEKIFQEKRKQAQSAADAE